MIQITLKAKHLYLIAYQLRTFSIEQYFSLISRFKTALSGNTDLETSFTISSSPDEVTTIFKILTQLPEGVVNTINVEMDDLLLPQIVLGVADEQANGIGPDNDGNLPDNAYWQILAKNITAIKASNASARNSMISQGQAIIDKI